MTADEGSPHLTDELANLSQRIADRAELLSAVILRCGGAFWVTPPTSAVDCGALGESWGRATEAIAGLSAPTVAVIDGDCIGAAWELALACDLRIAASTARIGSPEIRWG